MFASNIQKSAIVQSLPNNKGEVEILANSMKLSVSWEFLKPKTAKESRFKPARISKPKREEAGSTSAFVDVRGQTAEEAIYNIDNFCDDALMKGQEKVKVIHGHGTQVLKKAIRKHLARVEYSERWQSGGDTDGGDGVTWIYLK